MGGISMIGKILAEGIEKLNEKGVKLRNAAGTGAVRIQNRAYIESLTYETRVIDSMEASTEMSLFGETFATPIMTGALSTLNHVVPNAMVEIAKGALASGAGMWVGIGKEDELKDIIRTGVKTIKAIKPYRDEDLIFEKIAQCEKHGAFAIGMDIIFCYGAEIEDSVARMDVMSPKTQAQLRAYKEATKLPFILKGILSAQDAQKALDIGADAIVVSTHGGQVVDYAVPPMKVLPSIAKVIGEKIPILLDSELVRGMDVFKALALGATGVLVGRPVIYGLAYGEGADGVQQVITGMNEELRRSMLFTGSPDIHHIDANVIWE